MTKPAVEDELGRIQELVAMELGDGPIRTIGLAPRTDTILVVTDGGIIVETGEPTTTEIVPWYYVEQTYKGLARRGQITLGNLPPLDDPAEAAFRSTFLFGLLSRFTHLELAYTPDPVLSYHAVDDLEQIRVRPEDELPAPPPELLGSARVAVPEAVPPPAVMQLPGAVAPPAPAPSAPAPLAPPAAPVFPSAAPASGRAQPAGQPPAQPGAGRCLLCGAAIAADELSRHVRRTHDLDFGEYRRAFLDVPSSQTWIDLGDGRVVLTLTRILPLTE